MRIVGVIVVVLLAMVGIMWVLYQQPQAVPPAPAPLAGPPPLAAADDALREAFAVDPTHLADDHAATAVPRTWRELKPESAADARRPAPGDVRDGVRILALAELSDYEIHAPPIDAEAQRAADYLNRQIPSRIRKLDGQRVRLEGYLFPIQLEGGKAIRYLIMADYLKCCFADLSGPNEWADVTDPKGLVVDLATPVSVTGTLRVGAEPLAAAGVSSIYQIAAEASRIVPPPPVESPLPEAF